MMRTNRATRQVLAVMVVATALCAEQIASATPLTRAQVGRPETAQTSQVVQLASRLVDRLSRTFRQSVPAAFIAQSRHAKPLVPVRPMVTADQSLSVTAPPLSPFQFRLPPPTA